ncbi:hypothetical protein CR513_57840, partial [Mucuna pruriens]
MLDFPAILRLWEVVPGLNVAMTTRLFAGETAVALDSKIIMMMELVALSLIGIQHAVLHAGKEYPSRVQEVICLLGMSWKEFFYKTLCVYSFGVMLLEIIRGRRNTSNYNADHPLNLIVH